MMKLKSLTIGGYRGIHPEQPLVLDRLGHQNVFIGPNNAGKSTALRFLFDLVNLHRHVDWRVVSPTQVEGVGEAWFWQRSTEHRISATFSFEVDPDKYAHPLISPDKECRIQVIIQRSIIDAKGTPGPEYWVIVAPYAKVNEWCPVVRVPSTAGSIEMLDVDGGYTDQKTRTGKLVSGGANANPKSNLVEEAKPLLTHFRAWISRLYFFDAVRSLDRPPIQVITSQSPGDDQEITSDIAQTKLSDLYMQDGSSLLAEWKAWQDDSHKSAQYDKLIGRLLKDLNRVLNSTYRQLQVKKPIQGSTTPILELKMDSDGAAPISISRMGTGISQIIVLLFSLRKDEILGKRDRVYCLEEPETHLHPTLLRRLLDRLREVKDATFLVSTHSPILINELSDVDRLFDFHQESDGRCIAEACEQVIQRHAILDRLGVAGSDLLQTNCVVWVEGPSDRLYLQRWLEAHRIIHHPEDPLLLEGSDYSFILYGGALLAHYTVDIDSISEFIGMLKISRFSAILMDRDQTPLKRHTQRILEESASDPTHRLAQITTGKEIENDLPANVFWNVVTTWLKLDPGRFTGYTLPNTERYPTAIVDHLGLNDSNNVEAIKKKLADKVALAERIDKAASPTDWQRQIPSYLEPLYRFIRNSRGTK